MQNIIRYAKLTLGCIIFALGFSYFISPADLAPGGVSGLAVIISHYLPTADHGFIILMINIPLLIWGAYTFGWSFLGGTLWSTVVSSVAISIFDSIITRQVEDLFSSSVLGGYMIGVGLGIVFRENATTGGTDIAVKLIKQRFDGIKTGYIFLIVDSIIVLLSGLVFENFSVALFSFIALTVSALSFNMIVYFDFRNNDNS